MDDEARFFVIGGLAFATGLLVGVGAGLLMAPQSGSRTRRQIGNFVEDIREDASNVARDTKGAVEDVLDGVIEKGKRLVR